MNIEGRNPVKEALKSNAKISKVYIQKGLHGTEDIIDHCNKFGIRLVFSDKRNLDKMSTTGRHQGLIAVANDFEYCTVSEIIDFAKQKKEKLLVLILDGIEDPHNLGSIIRSAECMGVHGIIIPDRRSVTVNETVMRTSAGAVNHMHIAMVKNINDTIRDLKDDFVTIYAAEADGESAKNIDLTCDLALVIGSEGFGVKDLTKKLSDKTISIPQLGQVNSLNASVATGVLLYETIRQRF